MCGIAGVLGGDPDARRAALRRLVEGLRHRGPDGQGWSENDAIDLAHTRLAVLDPTDAASQPMRDPASGCVLLFNGEIYNYVELRDILRSFGHRFTSTGDTEVLLAAYLQWDDDFLDRLNGMFAIAIWDPRRRALLLARDRFGEKPMHLYRTQTSLWFSSEAGALVVAGIAPAEIDEEAIWRYLAFGDLGHPSKTCFSGITQLPPASATWIDATGAEIRRWTWWSPPMPRPRERRARWTTGDSAELLNLFTDSVRIRLRSDVPVGTSLSGGLDSSTVLATMRALHPNGELHSFTASFPNSDADELPLARRVADYLDVLVHPVPLSSADLCNDIDAMARANDQPVEAASQYAQYAVMRCAREAGVTVLLDGQGADETWGGYEKYVSIEMMDKLLTGHLGGALARARSRKGVTGAAPKLDPNRYFPLALRPALAKLVLSGRSFVQPAWLSAEFRHRYRNVDPTDSIDIPRRLGHAASTACYLDVMRVTLPRLLRYGDRNSMAWSREVRLPFLDHRLVEFALQIPLEIKLDDGWTKTPIRCLLENLGLPETARRRDKKAYMPPQTAWLEHPVLSARVREGADELFEAGYLARAEPPQGVVPQWRILSLTAWLSAFAIRP